MQVRDKMGFGNYMEVCSNFTSGLDMALQTKYNGIPNDLKIRIE